MVSNVFFDREVLSPRGLIRFAGAAAIWRTAKFPVELHILAKGGHGFGMTKDHLPTDNWYELYRSWLKEQGFLPAAIR